MPRYTYPEPTTLELLERIERLEKRQGLETAAIGYRATEQGCPNNTSTVIKLDKKLTDPANRIDIVNGYYIVPEEGFYQVNGQVILNTVAGEYIVVASIFVNGVKVATGAYLDVKWIEALACSVVSQIVFCKKGDHIELAVFQNTGAERKTFLGGSESNRLSVSRIDVTSGKEGRPGEKGEKGEKGEGATIIAGGVVKFKWAVKGFFSETIKVKPGFKPKTVVTSQANFAGAVLVTSVSNMGEVEKLETEEPALLMKSSLEVEAGSEFRGSWLAIP